MKTASETLLSEWAAQVTWPSSGAACDPQENLLVFSARDAQAAGVSVPELSKFLVHLGDGIPEAGDRNGSRRWFYAWYDEMSGTLRASFTEAAQSSDLPFRCSLEICETPDPVCTLALADGSPGEIPHSDLEEVAPEDFAAVLAADLEPEDFVLTVFARAVEVPRV